MTGPRTPAEIAARLVGSCEVAEAPGPADARVSARHGRQYVVKRHADRAKHGRPGQPGR